MRKRCKSFFCYERLFILYFVSNQAVGCQPPPLVANSTMQLQLDGREATYTCFPGHRYVYLINKRDHCIILKKNDIKKDFIALHIHLWPHRGVAYMALHLLVFIMDLIHKFITSYFHRIRKMRLYNIFIVHLLRTLHFNDFTFSSISYYSIYDLIGFTL